MQNFFSFQTPFKGPVKLMKLVKIPHSFSVCVKSVPLYRFKIVYVVLQMAVKEFFETFPTIGEIGRFIRLLLTE